VDGDWSKRSHRHSYNVNSGVAAILGVATKQLLYIGVRSKYCSICAVSNGKGIPAPEHKCYHNWSGSSSSMEADIILQGFLLSESIHGVRYHWMIGDGDSSAYNSVVTGCLKYGKDVIKVECANHAIKCYCSRLEGLCNDKPQYRGHFGLTPCSCDKAAGSWSRCAIKMYSKTGDVSVLHHGLRNGP